MSDDQLVNQVAALWVENGGDRDGVLFCLDKLLDAVEKEHQRKVLENG